MIERHIEPVDQTELIQRLRLHELKKGDRVTITIGADEEAWKYVFEVEEAGQWPQGRLKAFAPDGSETESVGFSLHGSGAWTTRQQNPVQKQERGFTSYFDTVYLNDFLVGRFDGELDRAVFDKPGQQITHIALDRNS